MIVVTVVLVRFVFCVTYYVFVLDVFLYRTVDFDF